MKSVNEKIPEANLTTNKCECGKYFSSKASLEKHQKRMAQDRKPYCSHRRQQIKEQENGPKQD